jgi:transposase-like protein
VSLGFLGAINFPQGSPFALSCAAVSKHTFPFMGKLGAYFYRVREGATLSQAFIARSLFRRAQETLTYYAFPEEHWRRVRTNNPLERLLREIRRRTRVVGAFPDGQSALNLAAARLRHIAGTAWSTKRYLNIELLKDQQMRGAITA